MTATCQVLWLSIWKKAAKLFNAKPALNIENVTFHNMLGVGRLKQCILYNLTFCFEILYIMSVIINHTKI